MPKVTNKELNETLDFIKGKLSAEEAFAKEHRSWEVIQIERLHKKIDAQNGRIRKTEITLGWFKGIASIFSIIVGWMFKKTI
tara:strand:+ start:1362 stop:1607 length:246 start_codon:yes stop_codon:yes gene_type:complete